LDDFAVADVSESMLQTMLSAKHDFWMSKKELLFPSRTPIARLFWIIIALKLTPARN
jgi:hypothetical protein